LDYGFQNNVTVTNDYPQTYSGLVASSDVLNFDLTNKYHNSVTLTAGPASRNVAFTIPTLSGLTTTYFVEAKIAGLDGQSGERQLLLVLDNVYGIGNSCKWYFCATKHFADLTALQTLPMVCKKQTL
jgi:hypothetical protein